MGLGRAQFYDSALIAILPMGFCYPGTGRSGDLPPRPECAPAWRARLLTHLPHLQLTLVIGRYAQAWHLPSAPKRVTDVVSGWRSRWPELLPLPHPSPRNNRWLKQNPWFEATVIPVLRARVARLVRAAATGPTDPELTPPPSR
jgi:uracil-DNA glycosylase